MPVVPNVYRAAAGLPQEPAPDYSPKSPVVPDASGPDTMFMPSPEERFVDSAKVWQEGKKRLDERIRLGFQSYEEEDAKAAVTLWLAVNKLGGVDPQGVDYDAATTAYFGRPLAPLDATTRIQKLTTPYTPQEQDKVLGPTIGPVEKQPEVAPGDILNWYEQRLTPAGRNVAAQIAYTGTLPWEDLRKISDADKNMVFDYAALRSGNERKDVFGALKWALAETTNMALKSTRGDMAGDDSLMPVVDRMIRWNEEISRMYRARKSNPLAELGLQVADILPYMAVAAMTKGVGPFYYYRDEVRRLAIEAGADPTTAEWGSVLVGVATTIPELAQFSGWVKIGANKAGVSEKVFRAMWARNIATAGESWLKKHSLVSTTLKQAEHFGTQLGEEVVQQGTEEIGIQALAMIYDPQKIIDESFAAGRGAIEPFAGLQAIVAGLGLGRRALLKRGQAHEIDVREKVLEELRKGVSSEALPKLTENLYQEWQKADTEEAKALVLVELGQLDPAALVGATARFEERQGLEERGRDVHEETKTAKTVELETAREAEVAPATVEELQIPGVIETASAAPKAFSGLRSEKVVSTSLDDFRSQVKKAGVRFENTDEFKATIPLLYRGRVHRTVPTVDQWLATAKDMGLAIPDGGDQYEQLGALLTGSNKQSLPVPPLILTAGELRVGEAFTNLTDGSTEIVIEQIPGGIRTAGGKKVQRYAFSDDVTLASETRKATPDEIVQAQSMAGEAGFVGNEPNPEGVPFGVAGNGTVGEAATPELVRARVAALAPGLAESAVVAIDIEDAIRQLGLSTAEAERLRTRVAELGVPPAAFVHRDVPVFLLSNIGADQVDRMVLHEAFHIGLRKAFGEDRAAKLMDALASELDPVELAEIGKRYGLDLETEGGRGWAQAAEEFMAKAAEDKNLDVSTWERIVAAVRRFLRDIGVVGEGSWTDADIRALITEAKRATGATQTLDKTAIDAYIQAEGIPDDQRGQAASDIADGLREIAETSAQAYLPGFEPSASQGRGAEVSRSTVRGVGNGSGSGDVRRETDRTAALPLHRLAAEALSNPSTSDAWSRAFASSNLVSSLIQEHILRKIPSLNLRGIQINNPRDFAALLMPLRSPWFETMKVAYVDENNRVLDFQVLTIGTVNRALISPQSVLRSIPPGSRGVILAHNHPSGNPTPSLDDIDCTRALEGVLRQTGLRLVDHVITDGGKYLSMAEMTLIEGSEAFNPRKDRGNLTHLEHRKNAIPPMDDQASWEALSRSQLQLITGPPDMEPIVRALRQSAMDGGNQDVGHVIFLNTKHGVTAVSRFLLSESMADRVAAISEQAAREGSIRVLLDLGSMSNDKAMEYIRLCQSSLKPSGVTILDTSTSARSSFQTLNIMESVALFEVPADNSRFALADQNTHRKTPDHWARVVLAERIFKGEDIGKAEVAKVIAKVGLEPNTADTVLADAREMADGLDKIGTAAKTDSEIRAALRKAELWQHYGRLIDAVKNEAFDAGKWTGEAQRRMEEEQKAVRKRELAGRLGLDLAKLKESGVDLVEKAKTVIVPMPKAPKRTAKAAEKQATASVDQDEDTEPFQAERQVEEVNLVEEEAQDKEAATEEQAKISPEKLADLDATIREEVRKKLVAEGLFTDKTTKPERHPEYKAEYVRTWHDVLAAALHDLDFSGRRAILTAKVEKLATRSAWSAIEGDIKAIVTSMNQGLLKQDAKTYLRRIARLLNAKKVKAKDSATKDIYRKQIDPKAKAWLRLVRNAVVMTGTEFETRQERIGQWLNETDLANVDEQTGKRLRNELEGWFPALKDAYWRDLGIDDVAMSAHAALVTYGDMRNKRPEVLAALYEQLKAVVEAGELAVEKIRAERKERTAELTQKTAAATIPRDGKSHEARKGLGKIVEATIAANYIWEHKLADLFRFGRDANQEGGQDVIRHFRRLLAQANSAEDSVVRNGNEAIGRAIGRIYGKSWGKVVKDLERPRDEYQRFSKGVAVKQRLSKASLMQILGTWEQRDYQDQLRKLGRGEEYISDLRTELSAQDIEFMHWMRGWYAENRVALSEQSMRVSGVPIVSPDDLYLPAVMLGERSGLEGTYIGLEITPRNLSARIRHGHDLDERASILGVFNARLISNAHYLGFAEVALEFRGVFGTPAFRHTVEETYGHAAYTDFCEHVMRIMNGGDKFHGSQQAIDKARDIASMAIMGSNIRSALANASGLPSFALELGFSKTLEYAAEGCTPTGVQAIREILASEAGKNRYTLGGSEQLRRILSNPDNGRVQKLIRGYMVSNLVGDGIALLVAQGHYRDIKEQELKKGVSEEVARERAATMAIDLIERTQASAQQKDLASWQNDRFGRVLGQFLTSVRQQASYEALAIRSVFAGQKDGWRRMVNVVIVNHVLVPAVYWAVREMWAKLMGEPPDDDDSLLPKDLLAYMLAGPMSGIVLVGGAGESLIRKLVTGKSWQDTVPAADTLAKLGMDTKDLIAGLNPATFDLNEALNDAWKVAKHMSAPLRDIDRWNKNRE